MTTAYIKNLIDCNGDIIYPQTKLTAIYDNNGNSLSDVMAYRSISTRSTLLASNWNSTAKTYSFEYEYSSFDYDIDVKIDSDNCTDEQLDAWIAAKPLGSLTNKINAKGDLPNVDIPVIITTTYNPKSFPYLSFIGNEDFTLKTYKTTKHWDGILEYSTDTTTWNTWDGTEISSSGHSLYLRGTGNTKIAGDLNTYRFVFTGASALKIACKGNIENLLDYNTVGAGNHPTMAERCYEYMFQGCKSLTSAPELPATKLSYRCYSYMFSGCTSLISTPILPATTLANYCYEYMFQDCTSLTTAPELPATTLANSCYSGMFKGCTSLTSVSALPATKLAVRCYDSMFSGCTNIKLSSTQTGEYQTVYRIPASWTGTTNTNALTNMFTNTGGSFTGTPEINTTYYTSNTVV